MTEPTQNVKRFCARAKLRSGLLLDSSGVQHIFYTLSGNKDAAHACRLADLQVPVFDQSFERAKADTQQFGRFLPVIYRVILNIQFLNLRHLRLQSLAGHMSVAWSVRDKTYCKEFLMFHKGSR